MYIQFVPNGRLGNAIFRYLACVILCKYYHAEYLSEQQKRYKTRFGVSDAFFQKISAGICSNHLVSLGPTDSKESEQTFVTMFGYYQHDTIYFQHKQEIIEYILAHPDHVIYTDRRQKYLVQSFVHIPESFNKRYPFVLHLRLEDFLTHNLYIPSERLVQLLTELIQTQKLEHQLVIVCNQPTKEEERKYIQTIVDVLDTQDTHIDPHPIQIIFEHNDPLTDYYILREAETLIASNSTLCWAATFFSSRLKTCYFPKYPFTANQTFCKPVEQTFYY
jgi:hypothetical protein